MLKSKRSRPQPAIPSGNKLTKAKSKTKQLHATRRKMTTQQPQKQQQSQTHTQHPPNSKQLLKRKRWAVTWGLSSTNALGRTTDVQFDPHPQRVILPVLAGDAYIPFQQEFQLYDNIPEEGIADVNLVAAGWSTNLVTTDEGRVFQWGFRNPTRAMVKRMQYDKKYGLGVGKFFENTIGYHPWSGGSPKPVRIPCFGAESDEQLRAEAERAQMVLPQWMTAKRMVPVKIATSSDNRGVLTAGGHLFTWSEVGDMHGSTGQGKEYSQLAHPRLIPIPDVIDFSFGYNHLSFITTHGTLYSCGNTDGGATGLAMAFVNLNAKKKRIFRPLSVHTNYEKFMGDVGEATRTNVSSATSNVSSDTSSALVATDQHDNSYSIQMGGSKTQKINLAQFASRTHHINPKFIGGREVDSHEAMRLTGHDLLTNIVQFVNWKGVEGKEGCVDPVNMLASNEIPATLPKFKSVACGFAHTLVLDEKGSVWSHGRNAHGELGHTLNPFDTEGRGDIKQHTTVNDGLQPVDFRTHYFPTKVKALANLNTVKVSAGLHHSAILTKEGDVYTFGNNEFGQCGRLNELPSTLRSPTMGHKQPWALSPGKLYISPNVLNGARVADVICGFYDTSVILSDGRCLMAGGYLSKEGHPRGLFSLKEFDPIIKQQLQQQSQEVSENDNSDADHSEESYESDDADLNTTPTDPNQRSILEPNTWIQSLPSRDMIPRSLYSLEHNKELQKLQTGLRDVLTSTSDQSYFMKSMTFGWQHVLATAIPRSHTDGSSGEATTVQHQALAPSKVFEIDDSLLNSPEAKDFHESAEAGYTSSAFDSMEAFDPDSAKLIKDFESKAKETLHGPRK